MRAHFVGGFLNNQMFADVNDAKKVIQCIGYTEDLTEKRNQGILVRREELDNQPQFEGYLGPMWDGDCLRYETQEVYDMLSR